MDQFTKKANNLLKGLIKEGKETVVYSSEEDAETTADTDQSMKQLGITPQTLAAATIATKVGAVDPQKQKALRDQYGRLMSTLANRLKGIKI
jgi:hypothetical protein